MEFNLADLFEIVTDTVPDRLALIAGDQRLTYRQLDHRASAFAHHLVESGVRRGDRVGIYAFNRAEWLEAMIGAFKARAVPVNINYRYVMDELLHVLDDADVVSLVYERSFAPLVAQLKEQLPLLVHRVVLEDGSEEDSEGAPSYEEAIGSSSKAREFPDRSPDDVYMLYTGGTTGLPKGVVWRQEDIFFGAMGGGGFGTAPIRTPEEIAQRVVPDEAASVHLVSPPLMHGGGQWVSFINLFGGQTVLLHTGRHFDAAHIWRLAEAEGAVSVMIVGDAMGRPLAEMLADPGFSCDTSRVAAIGSGGAILSTAVKDQLRSQLPHAVIVDSFGASETGANGSVMDLDGPAKGPRFTMGDHTTVLDDRLRRVAPGSGVVGKLARTGHIPLRYHKDEKKTAATFPVDAGGVRWVVAGDFATVEPDGSIALLGRGSVSINSGGEKVFPEEVEAALKSHPDVFDAVVVGVPDVRLVEKVTAIVQCRSATSLDAAAISEHCRRRIAAYKVPRELYSTDRLIRTPAGKPDYRWARAHAMEAHAMTVAASTGTGAGPADSQVMARRASDG